MIIKDDKILLIKTSYGRFLVMPGGGVKRNESYEQAGIRETHEEAQIIIDEFSEPLGNYLNTTDGRHDEVQVLIAKSWQDLGFRQSWEIEDRQWFDMHNLPDNVATSVKKRTGEYLSGQWNIQAGDW